MITSETTYSLENESDARRVTHALRERFAVRAESTAGTRRTIYYDTFDWRLHHDDGFLQADRLEEGWLVEWRSRDGTLRRRIPLKRPPAFVQELPSGEMKDALAKVVGVRRLLPLAELSVTRRTFRILDDEEKTVLYALVEVPEATRANGSRDRHRLARRLRLAPVKGYVEAQQAAVRFVEGELGLPREAGGEISAALDALGVVPGSYTSKLDVALDPAMPAGSAMRRVLRTLLATIRANEEGTRANLDAEFLHDLRVAVRRTRTCTSQLSRVFDRRALEPFRRELRWLGRVTGPTRDLDVFAIKLNGYARRLPTDVREDLAPLRDVIELWRSAEQRRLADHLASRRYEKLVTGWARFLEDDRVPADGAPDAARPILQVARERIEKRYRRVLSRGGKISAESPAEDLHALRIDAKKLRYLLEFFRSLFDGKSLRSSLKALKALQDNLGDFNDLEVQSAALVQYADEMIESGEATAPTLIAMGRLVEHLDVARSEERRRFQERFATFASAENQVAFGRMLRASRTRQP